MERIYKKMGQLYFYHFRDRRKRKGQDSPLLFSVICII